MKTFSKKELKWLDRLQKTLNAQPDTIIGFCTGTQIDFFKGKELPRNENGIESDGAVSGNEEMESVVSKNWDAGAY